MVENQNFKRLDLGLHREKYLPLGLGTRGAIERAGLWRVSLQASWWTPGLGMSPRVRKGIPRKIFWLVGILLSPFEDSVVRTEALSLGVEIKKSLIQGSQTRLLTQSTLRDSAAINPTLTTNQTMQLLFQC